VNTPLKAFRYGTRSQGISQLYLHTPRSSANGMYQYISLYNIRITKSLLLSVPVLGMSSLLCFRPLEPNSETGRSRSLARKRGTAYHNQSALLTVYIVSSENLNFIFLTHVLMFELLYVYSCNALSARFFAVNRALNSYFMIIYDYAYTA